MKSIIKSTAGLLTVFFFISLSQSGCLKTRSQVRGDDSAEAERQGMPAHIEPVEPKGSYVVDELKSEITRLTGRIEDLERKQTGTESQGPSADDLQEVEKRIQELEQAQIALIERMQKLEGNVATKIDSPNKIQDGKTALAEADYESAIQHFSDYLKNPKGKYAEDAYFYRGESYFGSKQYKKAITDYAQFPEKFTKSKYMPEALYKIGLSFQGLNNREDARAFFQELIDKFPKSAQAKLARTKLK